MARKDEGKGRSYLRQRGTTRTMGGGITPREQSQGLVKEFCKPRGKLVNVLITGFQVPVGQRPPCNLPLFLVPVSVPGPVGDRFFMISVTETVLNYCSQVFTSSLLWIHSSMLIAVGLCRASIRGSKVYFTAHGGGTR